MRNLALVTLLAFACGHGLEARTPEFKKGEDKGFWTMPKKIVAGVVAVTAVGGAVWVIKKRSDGSSSGGNGPSGGGSNPPGGESGGSEPSEKLIDKIMRDFITKNESKIRELADKEGGESYFERMAFYANQLKLAEKYGQEEVEAYARSLSEEIDRTLAAPSSERPPEEARRSFEEFSPARVRRQEALERATDRMRGGMSAEEALRLYLQEPV